MSKLTWVKDGDDWLGYETDDGTLCDGQKPIVKIYEWHGTWIDRPCMFIGIETPLGDIDFDNIEIQTIEQAKAYCEERFNKEWWKNE